MRSLGEIRIFKYICYRDACVLCICSSFMWSHIWSGSICFKKVLSSKPPNLFSSFLSSSKSQNKTSTNSHKRNFTKILLIKCTCYIFHQVTGSDIRADRRRWKCRRGSDTSSLLQRIAIQNRDRHNSDGSYHNLLHSPYDVHILSTMGRSVLGSIIQRHNRRELLHV